ncbi:hypothetical protein SARC_12432 [Sphaeroforma arctica JP610]|uniref:SAP domain-containing protein n=1 Tax=Sphaeroforma arctica JP610 TaxID=667725 RepID=A0A0L0FE44_9EUKA|nr:hypothetical protein SARC_12432 [Sphaeroforma arctica JP610]KNC75037.1 hypothetical protein SARC_12432 [Sphaeroforma arctica JP610]|eukprot:XP_014148939.1 hypothetical protein SARC_12432 [Sphaeroforma arctica JP610]
MDFSDDSFDHHEDYSPTMFTTLPFGVHGGMQGMEFGRKAVSDYTSGLFEDYEEIPESITQCIDAMLGGPTPDFLDPTKALTREQEVNTVAEKKAKRDPNWFSTLKNDHLKKLLQVLGLHRSGTKAQLVDRLLDDPIASKYTDQRNTTLASLAEKLSEKEPHGWQYDAIGAGVGQDARFSRIHLLMKMEKKDAMKNDDTDELL